jgi:hypothetical protein
MECMTASQSSDIIIFLQGIDADGTRVSWIGKKLWWNSGMNVIVLIVGLIVLAGNCSTLVDGTGSRLNLFQSIVLFNSRRRNSFLSNSCIIEISA